MNKKEDLRCCICTVAGSSLGKLAGPFRGQVHLHKFLMNSLNGTRELMKGPNVHSTAV